MNPFLGTSVKATPAQTNGTEDEDDGSKHKTEPVEGAQMEDPLREMGREFDG